MKNFSVIILNLFIGLGLLSCTAQTPNVGKGDKSINVKNMEGLEQITFGNGCFWCTEAIFQQVEGVVKAESGYSGGHVKNPGYREVCNGTTGHAEVIQVTFDPQKVGVVDLLEIFWKTHDPTTLNRQGADVGTQYRSAVFYHNEEQRQLAEEYKAKLDKADIWDDPIVTEITEYSNYYKAEEYHQDYYSSNTEQGYCRVVITPKVEKFQKVFADKLRKELKAAN